MTYKIAVFGSADKLPSGTRSERARVIGRELAKRGAELYTGGCWGPSYEAVQGAREVEGTRIIAVSPAVNKQEHADEFGYPTHGFDDFKFPASGKREDRFLDRSMHMINLVDKAVALYGSIGTLCEIVNAIHQYKDVAVLLGEDGWDDFYIDFLERPEVRRRMKGGRVIYDQDPEILVARLFE